MFFLKPILFVEYFLLPFFCCSVHTLCFFLLQDNDYITAIKSVGSVLTPYDSDNQFPVFGFGARFRHNKEVSHCFPLNFNPEHPEVYGVQVITLYSCYYQELMSAVS